MPWVVKWGVPTKGKNLEHYMNFEAYTWVLRDNPIAATRFHTKKEAEAAAFNYVASDPTQIGNLWVEKYPGVVG